MVFIPSYQETQSSGGRVSSTLFNSNVTVINHVDFLQHASCVFSVTCRLDHKAEESRC